MIIRKSQQEIEGMARAGELVYETLQLVAEHLEPGVTMLELDRIADEHIASKGGIPTSKGYKGFPGCALHLAELDGRARDPERRTARRRAT